MQNNELLLSLNEAMESKNLTVTTQQDEQSAINETLKSKNEAL